MYAITNALLPVQELANKVINGQPTQNLYAIERSRAHLEQVLQPNFVRTRLELALEQLTPYEMVNDAPPDTGRMTLRRALVCLRGDTALDQSKVPLFCAALGASVLCVQAAEHQQTTETLNRIARHLLSFFQSWASVLP